MSHRQTHFPHGSPLSSAETKAPRAAADHEESGGCGFRSGIRKRGRLPANDAIQRHAPLGRFSLTLAIERLSATTTTTTACARALSSGAPARTTAPPRPVRILCPTKPAASSLRSPPTRPLRSHAVTRLLFTRSHRIPRAPHVTILESPPKNTPRPS